MQNIIQVLLLGFPVWISWTSIAGFISASAAWVALYLSIRQAYKDRTILLFSLKRTWVEANNDQDPDGTIDGTPFVYAIAITVTNNGLRPITIKRCRCIYGSVTSEAGINQKIGQGDSCTGFVRVDKCSKIVAASVIDSTEKEWKAKPRIIREFAKTHFPLHKPAAQD